MAGRLCAFIPIIWLRLRTERARLMTGKPALQFIIWIWEAAGQPRLPAVFNALRFACTGLLLVM